MEMKRYLDFIPMEKSTGKRKGSNCEGTWQILAR
jgi:hypothetical protein